MGIQKQEHIDYLIIDELAEKVANEPIDDVLEKWIIGDTEDGYMPLVKKPQHIIDEEKVDEAIQRMYDLGQQEMFDDPIMNWSGLR
jgi:hypothetical protein